MPDVLLFTCFATRKMKQNQSIKKDNTYYKNICVSLISAKRLNPSFTVALVTNAEVPTKYLNILTKESVEIFYEDFDDFTFDKKYKWELAFYKLCAFEKMLKRGFEKYILLDNDTYVATALDSLILELNESIMLYDINHGLNTPNYLDFVKEVSTFDSKMPLITHYGGEFIATSKFNGLVLLKQMKEIYDEIKRRDFVTTKGDEFIVSIAAHFIKNRIKNASPYICRYWTRTFRLVCSNYRFNPVCIYHVPSEKQNGFISIFNYYCLFKRMPKKKKVWKMLHLSKDYLLCKIKRIVNKW